MKYTSTKSQFVLKINTDRMAVDPDELEAVFGNVVWQIRQAHDAVAGPALNGDSQNVGEWTIYKN